MNPLSALGQVAHSIGNGIGAVGGAIGGQLTDDLAGIGRYMWHPQATAQATKAMPDAPFSLGMHSPVPTTKLTNQINPQYQAPIPQNQIALRPMQPSGFQNTMTGLGNFGHQVASFFGGGHPQQPLQQAVQGAQVRVPTPTTDPVLKQQWAEPMEHPLVSHAQQRFGGQQQAPTQAPVQQQQNLPGVPQGAFSDFTTAPVPPTLAPVIYRAAQQAGVDPNVFASILFSEHGFQTTPGYNYNTDGSYDRGIAQINTKAHPDVTDQQALDPNFAIPYSANLLGRYIKGVGGDVSKGIAAYNVGVGGATVNGTDGPLGPQGQHYLDAVAHGLTPNAIKRLGIRVSNR